MCLRGWQSFSRKDALVPGETHTPNCSMPVFAKEQTAVFRNRDSNWPTPNSRIGCDKPGDEVVVLARRFSAVLVERHAHNFVAGAASSVPRPMERSKNVAAIFGRELVAGVKANIERSGMRLHQHIRNECFGGQLRMFAAMPRVFVSANVKPRPAVKSAGLNVTDVVRYEIFAEIVTFVRAHPQFVSSRPKCDPHGIANSPGENLFARTIRIKLENACSLAFRGIVRIIRAGAHRDIHLLSIRRKNDIARPMTAAAQQTAAGD